MHTLRLIAGLLISIAAQAAIAAGAYSIGILGYSVAVACVLFGTPALSRRVSYTEPVIRPISSDWRPTLLILAVATGIGTFWLSGGNRYRVEGVIFWCTSILCWWLAWADMHPPSLIRFRSAKRLMPLIGLLAAILLLGAIFRFLHLSINPGEMGSDHAEKLLDVVDVLQGRTYIFFERNTGREPWQFYWTVLLIKLFNLPPDFMALKLGTSLIGWLMLPAIFLLAHEVLGVRIALLATLFAAVASWAVIPARFGLRYPLAPCAVAWTMYFLVRGLRRNERNTMLAAGLCLGIGLQGYTAYRFMPVIVGLLALLGIAWHYTLHGRRAALQAMVNTSLALVLTVLVLMPLLRYGYDRPESLLYRATSRLTGQEHPIDGAVLPILLHNLQRVLLFFNHTYDVVPVVNLPGQPAMDRVLGALLVVGIATISTLSFKRRDPWPAALLGVGVLMLFPSALSIAYPGENPSIVRTGGAIPMLMIICAVGPGLLLEQTWHMEKRFFRRIGIIVVAGLSLVVVGLNADRVFRQYPAQYCSVALNASDIAHELQMFVDAGNSRANAWIVSYPHWVDYRAVGIWMGDITFSNNVFGADEANQIELKGQPGWFALNRHDHASLELLWQKYPRGKMHVVYGRNCPDEQFVVFTTPRQ